MREQVQRLTDRAESYDCMQRYARGIDRQDRALLRSVYHTADIDGDEAHAESLLTEEALAVVAGTPMPSHDRSDPSYDRPLAASRAAANVDQASAQT